MAETRLSGIVLVHGLPGNHGHVHAVRLELLGGIDRAQHVVVGVLDARPRLGRHLGPERSRKVALGAADPVADPVVVVHGQRCRLM